MSWYTAKDWLKRAREEMKANGGKSNAGLVVYCCGELMETLTVTPEIMTCPTCGTVLNQWDVAKSHGLEAVVSGFELENIESAEAYQG